MLTTYIEQLSRYFRKEPSTMGEKADAFFKKAVSQNRDDLAKYLLGSGSEALVFRLERPVTPNNQDRKGTVVLKAVIDRTLRYLDEETPPSREFIKFITSELEDEKRHLESDWKLLREEFGEAAPRTRFRVVQVPITSAEIEQHRPQWAHQSAQIPKELPLLLAVQRLISFRENYLRIDGSMDLSRNSFLKSDPRLRQEFAHAYQAILQPLEEESADTQLAAITRIYSEIKRNLGLIHSLEQKGDTGVREAFTKALQGLIRFVEAHRIPIDIAGDKNIILQQRTTAEGWDLKLIDPLPTEREHLDDLEKAILQLRKNPQTRFSLPQKRQLSYSLNTVLVLNGYAAAFHVDERIHVPHLATISPETWLQALQADT